MTSHKLGLLPPTARPRVHLSSFLTSEEPRAVSVDYLDRVTDWCGMLGNDQYGDCFWAGAAHLLIANAAYTQADPLTFDETGVLAAYTGGTGFNPDDPSTDQGTVLQDGLDYLTRQGITDTAGNTHKVVAFAQVNVTDPNEVDRAHQLFGATLNGFTVYRFAMDEFDHGKPWTEQARDRGPMEGGHCVPTMKTRTTDESRVAVTWGRPQGIGPRFWSRYFNECWAVITPEWVDAAGKSPSGLDLTGLMSEVDRLRSV